MTRVIKDSVANLAGVEQLRFKPTAVALLTTREQMTPAIGAGIVEHAVTGRRIAVAVSDGRTAFAALLTPAEAETLAARLLRFAAEAQSEGRA